MHIERCVCFNQTFADLRTVAEQHGCRTLEALQEHVLFGMRCRLCHPYVRRMLETGETVFYALLPDQIRPQNDGDDAD